MIKFPGGRLLFNRMFWSFIPYTGSIRPEIIHLEKGRCQIRIRDRKILRNHLNSIHAACLMNALEAVSGLAFATGLPENSRGILTDFSVHYIKKARGTLHAECQCDPPTTNIRQTYKIEPLIRDASGEIVATAESTWLVSPNSKSPSS